MEPVAGDKGLFVPNAAKPPASMREKIRHEAIAIAITTLYFALWLGVLMLLKVLILAEYQIKYHKFTAALIGALILAKVVLIMEHVPLGPVVRNRPAVFYVAIRSLLFALGVLVVLILEKAFDARHERGGFGASLAHIFEHPDMPHVWANALGMLCALVGYNVLSVIRRHLGNRSLIAVFLAPPPDPPKHDSPAEEKSLTQ
jgi:hypothetical protein